MVVSCEKLPLLARGRDRLETHCCVSASIFRSIPYSLGDAIDWKLKDAHVDAEMSKLPLLARGRDRLETNVRFTQKVTISCTIPYSLGDAIDWKPLERLRLI